MKRKCMFPLTVMLIFAMMVGAPAVAQGPCAVVTGGGQAECPLGYPFKIQFQISVDCASAEASKGFVKVTWPGGIWYKVAIIEAAVVDAPLFEWPYYWHNANGQYRWAAWGPHSDYPPFESIITLQGRAVWAYGEVVATNFEAFKGGLVLFGVLSKDQNGGGVPDYIFLPLDPSLPVIDTFDALVGSGIYASPIYFWLGLDQGHVTFNERSLD